MQECLPNICETLGSIPSKTHKHTHTHREQDLSRVTKQWWSELHKGESSENKNHRAPQLLAEAQRQNSKETLNWNRNSHALEFF